MRKHEQTLLRDPWADPVPLVFRRRGWEALAQRLALRGRLDLTAAISEALAASLYENPVELFLDHEDALEVTTTAHQIANEHGRSGRSLRPTVIHGEGEG